MDPVDGGGGSRQFHNLPNTGEPAQVVNTVIQRRYKRELFPLNLFFPSSEFAALYLYRGDVKRSCFP